MNLDDPKLTAYALGERGELTPAELRAIEHFLEKSEEARAFVAETAAFAQTLQREFRKELPEAGLTPAGRSVLREETQREKAPPQKRKVVAFTAGRRVAWAAGLSAVAAGIAVLLAPAFQMTLEKASPQQRLARMEARRERNEGKKAVALASSRVPSGESLRVEVDSAPHGKIAVAPEKSKEPDGIAISAPVSAAEPLAMRAPSSEVVPSQFRAPAMPLDADFRLAERGDAAERGHRLAARQEPGLPGLRGGAVSANNFNTEAYAALEENPFLAVDQNPLSTFSVDVDTASYSNVRRFLNAGRRPPVGAVRIEELLNYFPYDYPQPEGDAPFVTHVEVAQCPWQPAHRLVKIGLKGRELPESDRAASNLVFLIDVSGSMNEPDKLPLLKQSLRQLVERLRGKDRVAMVVYAGAAGVALPPTSGEEKEAILRALDGLQAGGSTNGASGIRLAYESALKSFIPGGVNRVILATDGDFNVGVTDESELVRLIEEQAKTGVYLTILGFGKGNLQDARMKKLSTKGNGNYAYIDSLREGRKVLVEQAGGTLVTIAGDVKIQVEFNPRVAAAYRLVGYENRLLAKEDFNDDRKDAGEIGAGHTVTALYEVVPVGIDVDGAREMPKVDPLKYQPIPRPTAVAGGEVGKELLTVKLRYKKPEGGASLLLEHPVVDGGAGIAQSSRDFRFAAAVAQFGMLLRHSSYAGAATWGSVKELAVEGQGEDKGGYRAEFLELVEKAARLAPER